MTAKSYSFIDAKSRREMLKRYGLFSKEVDVDSYILFIIFYRS